MNYGAKIRLGVRNRFSESENLLSENCVIEKVKIYCLKIDF